MRKFCEWCTKPYEAKIHQRKYCSQGCANKARADNLAKYRFLNDGKRQQKERRAPWITDFPEHDKTNHMYPKECFVNPHHMPRWGATKCRTIGCEREAKDDLFQYKPRRWRFAEKFGS